MGGKKSLTSLILLTIEKSVDGLVRFEHFAEKPHLYAYFGWWDRPLKKSALALALKRLRENGLVDFVDDKELVVRLTDRGKDKALWIKMKVIDEQWDNKWRIIIWDIPEKRRVARDLLRYKLKWLGFKQLQKSVWFTKKNCTQVLRDFIKQLGIKDWVVVLESDNVDF